MESQLQGVIVFFLPDKGYGYVRVPDTREEFRFRAASLQQPAKAGDPVSFMLKQTRNGYFADEIRLVKRS